MEEVIFGLVLLILIMTIFIVFCTGKKKKQCKRCQCAHCKSLLAGPYKWRPTERSEHEDPGLNDMDQTTKTRGERAKTDQPNHTANMWKAEFSQPQFDCHGRLDNRLNYSVETPLRVNVVNLDVNDVSKIRKLTGASERSHV